MLRDQLSGRPVQAPVWPCAWWKRSAYILRHDLEDAGIAYIDENGHYREFHALRHRYGTELTRAGVPLTVAQRLMRHNIVKLTSDRHSHPTLHDGTAAVASLPPVLVSEPDRSEAQIVQATGTDGPINDSLPLKFPTPGDGTR